MNLDIHISATHSTTADIEHRANITDEHFRKSLKTAGRDSPVREGTPHVISSW